MKVATLIQWRSHFKNLYVVIGRELRESVKLSTMHFPAIISFYSEAAKRIIQTSDVQTDPHTTLLSDYFYTNCEMYR